MIQTTQSSATIKKFMEDAKWEMDFAFPGPEGFYPKKKGVPHLHFLMQGGGNCYLHWKSALSVSTEINGFYIPNCPDDLKGKALDLLGKLKSTN